MTAGATSMTTTPQPHFIPRYTGYCPQYRFRCGQTYGNVTHKLLLDPTVNHAEKLVLSNRATDDFQTTRPAKSVIQIMNARFKRTDPIYIHPMIPGYEGFTPNLNGKKGQRYSVLATEGLTEFELQQQRNQTAINELRTAISVQAGQNEPRPLKDRLVIDSEFRFPMLLVRPEFAAGERSLPVEEPYEVSRRHAASTYFKDIIDPRKFFVAGYTGHVPHEYAQFGASNVPMTSSALADFTTNYRTRQSTEWAPVSISKPDPPLAIQSTEIYHKHVGLIPNYLGHVPGAAFRIGKTFGADTKNVKRWLRGDFS